MGKLLFYTAALVGTYLVVSHATQAGKLLTSAGGVYTSGVRTLQGR